jgi:hypothetical protein
VLGRWLPSTALKEGVTQHIEPANDFQLRNVRIVRPPRSWTASGNFMIDTGDPRYTLPPSDPALAGDNSFMRNDIIRSCGADAATAGGIELV